MVSVDLMKASKEMAKWVDGYSGKKICFRDQLLNAYDVQKRDYNNQTKTISRRVQIWQILIQKIDRT